MERLTRWGNDVLKEFAVSMPGVRPAKIEVKLAEYEDLGMSPHDLALMLDDYERMSNMVRDIEDAEEQGRLIKFPVGIGDHVWCFPSMDCKYREMIVVGLEADIGNANFAYVQDVFTGEYVCFNVKHLGESMFKTKAEAEAKLKKMEDESNG